MAKLVHRLSPKILQNYEEEEEEEAELGKGISIASLLARLCMCLFVCLPRKMVVVQRDVYHQGTNL